MRSRFAGRRGRDDESGWALLMVIGVTTALALLVTAVLSLSFAGTRSSQREASFQLALAAAEAGVDAYQAQLNANSKYFQTNTTGSGTVGKGTYTYQVLTPAATILSTGSLVLQSTGNVSLQTGGSQPEKRTRTIQVTLKKGTFLNYLYFTKYETIDPVATGQSAATCAVYAYNGRDAVKCPDIQFRTGDVINGDLHSEDQLVIAGNPKFSGKFTTAWQDPALKYWVDANGSGSAPQFLGGQPKYDTVTFPSTNSGLKAQAAVNGCVYQGPTRIVFNSAATMTVTSPFTKTSAGTGCALSYPITTAQTVPVPTGKVLYVDSYSGGVGTCTPSNLGIGFPIANDTAYTKGNTKLVYGCGNGDAFVEGWLAGQVTLASTNNIIVTGNLRYAGKSGNAVGTSIPTSAGTAPNANDISGDDLLGLAAANFVEVYHPVKCSSQDANGNCTAGTDVSTSPYPLTNLQIDAAIVASADSFIVQSWNLGSPANALTVYGAIIQQFRGPVGTSNNGVVATGYLKNYYQDNRLKGTSPPYLADLVGSTYSTAQGSWYEKTS